MVRRAAFDVGSGAVKMCVADLDMHAGLLPSIEREVHSVRENLLLSEELERSGGLAFPQVRWSLSGRRSPLDTPPLF